MRLVELRDRLVVLAGGAQRHAFVERLARCLRRAAAADARRRRATRLTLGRRGRCARCLGRPTPSLSFSATSTCTAPDGQADLDELAVLVGLRLVLAAACLRLSIVTVAPSTGWPLSSVTLPSTMPCLGGSRQRDSQSATSAARKSAEQRPVISADHEYSS